MRRNTPAPLLVAEDSADDLFLLNRLLKKAGVANPLCLAANGEEGIAFLQRVARGDATRPAAAIVDIKMPRMDGFELLAWIRQQPEFDDLPVIMLSSSSEARDVARAAALGAQYFFTKYPPEQTMARVMEAVTRFDSPANRRRVRIPHNLLP